MSTTISSLRAVVEAYEGAEVWWADVFFQLGWGVEETRLYMATAARSPGTLLNKAAEASLLSTLKVYAGPRGLLSNGEVKKAKGDTRVRHVVKVALTYEEREALLQEVAGMAVLEFKPQKNRCYIDHTVATEVSAVAWKWLAKQTEDGTVLEVGPKFSTVLLGGVDPERYTGYAPVLGPRDAVRHDVTSMVSRALKGIGNFSQRQRDAILAYHRNPSGFFKPRKIEDDDKQAEYIMSNHADYDIDLDDVPGIMAKHGARAWYGVVTRPKGLRRDGGVRDGDIPQLGVRYEVDAERDEISFHFRGRATFSYVHKFSSYVKREERNEYRWRGEKHDYVYTKLPVSTAATLAYAVYRVKKAETMFIEPTYLPSGSSGMVTVRSIRVYMTAGRWRVAPVDFEANRLALEKVVEMRRAMGTKGNIADVMQYLASVRIRFFLNGVAVGASHPLGVDLFAAAAVFVEAYVVLTRSGDELDGKALLEAYGASIKERGLISQVGHWISAVAYKVGSGPVMAVRRWREAIENMVAGMTDFEFSMKPCPDVVMVSDGYGEGVVKGEATSGACVCRELIDVRSALGDSEVYSEVELADLREYASQLESKLDSCKCAWRNVVEEEVGGSETSASEEASSASDTVVESECSDEEEDVFVDARSFDRRSAMLEYVGLMRHNKAALDSESVREAVLLFKGGIPDVEKLVRARVARSTPFLVRVANGRLVCTRGEGVVSEVGAIVDVNNWVVVPTVRKGKGGRVDVIGVADGWHYTSSQLKVYNGETLASAVETIADDDEAVMCARALDVRFVRGPFGAGKTRVMSELIARDVGAKCDVVYLSATVSSVEEMESRLATFGVSARCATFDSYCMNRSWRATRVYVDEGPMVHYGECLAALGKLRAREVAVFGDFRQIPFCSFTSEYETPLAGMESDVRVVKRMNVLHRCRLEVLAMWDHLYDGELVPCTCCAHVREEGRYSSVHRISTLNQVPVEKGTRYAVFTQREKDELREYVGAGVPIEVLKKQRKGGLATVHETQGGTYDDVIVVRSTSFFDKAQSGVSPSIYNREPYVLVASTRARLSLRYYTMSVERDALVRAIEGATEEKKAMVAQRSVDELETFDDLFTC